MCLTSCKGDKRHNLYLDDHRDKTRCHHFYSPGRISTRKGIRQDKNCHLCRRAGSVISRPTSFASSNEDFLTSTRKPTGIVSGQRPEVLPVEMECRLRTDLVLHHEHIRRKAQCRAMQGFLLEWARWHLHWIPSQMVAILVDPCRSNFRIIQ